MGNQQERSTEDLSFAAGVIVGEGCFTVSIPRQRHQCLFRPTFTISMDDEESMQILIDTFARHNLPMWLHRTKRGSLVMTATGYKRVKRYTETFIPYLTGRKKKAAVLVDRFIASRTQRAFKTAPTEEEIGFIQELRNINGCGTHAVPVEILRDYTSNARPK